MFHSTKSIFGFSIICFLLSGCATSTKTDDKIDVSSDYPSAKLVEQAYKIEQQHDISSLKLRLPNNIEASLLNLFVGFAQECDWHLSKWNKNTGRLGFLLDCNDGLNEIIFNGQLLDGDFQITDIYHHNMGIWLSQISQTMTHSGKDLVAWAHIVKAIETNNAAQVLTGLSRLTYRNFITQMLSIEYTQAFDKEISNKIMTYTLEQYKEQIQTGLFIINNSINKKDWPQALKNLEQIETKVGSSEVTQLKRSNIYWLAGNTQKAYYHVIHSYRYGIRTRWPINTLIAYSIEGNDYPAAMALLELNYSDSEDWNSDWLTEFPNGDHFIQQPAYIQWQQSVIQ